jgi:4a-hydroxytetrahydrobiopterin dehydratase
MAITRISESQLQSALAEIPGWAYNPERGGLIRKEFKFHDFKQAFGFMTAMAEHSEKTNHHPEWRNIYSFIEVTLTTHDASGLSSLDIEWAKAADSLAATYG